MDRETFLLIFTRLTANLNELKSQFVGTLQVNIDQSCNFVNVRPHSQPNPLSTVHHPACFRDSLLSTSRISHIDFQACRRLFQLFSLATSALCFLSAVSFACTLLDWPCLNGQRYLHLRWPPVCAISFFFFSNYSHDSTINQLHVFFHL